MSIGQGRLIERGDVYRVDLRDPDRRGSEQEGRRPAVIVSPGFMNRGNTVVIVPLSTSIPAGELPPHKVLVKRGGGLREDGVALCQQVRVIDKGRMDASREGRLSDAQIAELDDALRHTLGLD